MVERGQWLRESGAGYLTAPELDTVANFLDQLDRRCGDRVARVILFGSRARGDHEPESDIDLLIVTRDGKSSVKEIVRSLTNDEPYLSTLIMSADEYRRHQRLRDPLYINVRRDGVELWNQAAWAVEKNSIPLDFVEGEARVLDQPTRETIRTYFDRTGEDLEAAQHLRDAGSLRGANSVAYQGARHAATAALYAQNVIRTKHRDLEPALAEFLVEPGYVGEEYIEILRDLRTTREASDYDVWFTPDKEQTDKLVAAAKRFAVQMERLLREQGAFDDEEN